MEPSRTLSHYRLLEKIGEGGMGVVWKASDTVLGRTVAVKILPADVSRDERRRAMFLQEARLASQVSHAHVVQVHEFGREGDLDFIVMEYVEGKPLSALIRGAPFDADRVAAIGLQVAQALTGAHRKGLLHRDIKPSNILVTPDGEIKVVDFGLAVLSQGPTELSRVDMSTASAADAPTLVETKTGGEGGLSGTAPYMSPEQTRGEELDSRTDIFSLGVVLYEMTTGRRPFSGSSIADILHDIRESAPKPVHEIQKKVPLDLERIVHKAIAKRRSDRYQTMDDLAVDLRALARNLESGSSPSYADVQASRAGNRFATHPVRWLAAAVVAAAVAFWAWRGLLSHASLDERTVLILPFEVRGQTDGAEYVGRAFAESVATNLARAKAVRILPVPAADSKLDGSPKGRNEAARALGAGRLLIGAVTRGRDSVSASVNLVDVSQNRILWGADGSTFEDDLPTLAASLAHDAARELGVETPRLYGSLWELTGGPAMASSVLTSETLGALRRSDVSAVERSRELVEAFAQEPDAWTLRVAALNSAATAGSGPPAELRRELESALAELDRLDPRTPYSQLYRASVDVALDGNLAEGDAKLTPLLSRDDLTPAAKAWVFRRRGMTRINEGDGEGAVRDLEQARALSPSDADIFEALARALRFLGRNDEALERARQAAALAPNNWRYQHIVSLALKSLGRTDEALDASAKACAMSRSQQACAAHAGALFRAGRKDDAKEAFRDADALPATPVGTYNLACYLANVGSRRDALAYLRRAVGMGFTDAFVARDSDWATLRDDPEFKAIVADIDRRIAQRSAPGRRP